MSMKKIMLAAMAILVCSGLYAKPKVRLAPGASCYVWNENTFAKPDSAHTGAFVDDGEFFDALNCHSCSELKEIKENFFIMWEGYLQVPKSDTYRFTMNPRGQRPSIKIFINNKELFTYTPTKKKTTLSNQLKLNRGFARVRVYANIYRIGWNAHAPGASDRAGFNLRMAPVKAMKMSEITPATLFHKIDDER